MKKLVFIVLTIFVSFCFAGCGVRNFSEYTVIKLNIYANSNLTYRQKVAVNESAKLIEKMVVSSYEQLDNYNLEELINELAKSYGANFNAKVNLNRTENFIDVIVDDANNLFNNKEIHLPVVG